MSGKTAQDLREREETEPHAGGWDYNHELNPSQGDYDKKFSDLTSTPDMQAVNGQGDAIAREHGRGADTARQAVQDGEKKAVGDTAIGKAATGAAGMVNPVIGGAVKLLGKIKTRKGATGAVVAVVMVALIGLGSLLAGSLAPIAFISNVMDDLNDQLASLDIRQEKLLRTKIKALQQEFVQGCTKMSIRCKMRSISTADVERLKSQGIEVKGKTILNRVFPSEKGYTLEVDGKMRSVSASELADLIKTNPKVGSQVREAINMRFFGFADKAFRWFSTKVKASLNKPNYVGETDEERFNNFAKGVTTPEIPPGAKFIKTDSTDPKTGEPLYRIEGDVSADGKPTRLYSQAEVNAFQEHMTAMASTSKMPKPVAQLANIVNIVGMNDLACTAKNLIGAAAIASKYAKSAYLAKYGLEVGVSVNAIKAGDGTVRDGAIVGAFFGMADSRATILDAAKSIESASATGSNGGYAVDTAKLTSSDGVQMPNPEFGKNAMDSPLLKLSMADQSTVTGFTPTTATSLYVLGFSTVAAVALSGIATIMNYIPLTSDSSCAFIQNWGVRTVGFIIGVVAAFFSGGTALIKNIAAFVALTVVMVAVTNVLHNLATGSALPDDAAKKPADRAAATWTGLAVTSGQTGQLRGMIPGDEEDLIAYAPERRRVSALYNTMESSTVSPFDTTSDKSLIGRLALAIGQYSPRELTFSGIALSARQLVARGIAAPLPQAYADSINPSRLKQCDDKEYKELGLAADVQCNLRYYLPADDLKSDPDDVALWMENEGYVEHDTITGMPAGYTPPTPNESSNMITNFLSGFVSSFYATRNYGSMNNAANPNGSDYAKFLDYCVYRSMPYGKTYEEAGAYGDAAAEWKDGKMCVITPKKCQTTFASFSDCKRMAPIIAKFRIYTFDRSTLEITEDPVVNTISTSPSGGTGTQPSTIGNVKNGWVFPTPNWKGSFGNNIWGSCSVKCRHQGIDIGGNSMTVLAAHDGTIVRTNATTSGYGGGYLIRVTENGQPQNLYYAYQHMSSAPLKAGTNVTAGQAIGISGCTGNCQGPHIHFSVEKTAQISTYGQGAGRLDQEMPTYPPLCFLPTTGINLGPLAGTTTGEAYCSKFGL